ncbi:MAG: glycosyltransferase [Bacteroides sp.]|nr:glycosyltransferase [Bacteroides sp.]
MEFSVLMSLYAKEKPEYLRESLHSVFHQSLPPTEVVMVEDGPLTGPLYEVLDATEKEHPELKRVRLAENGGLGNALNEGLKHCTYDLVARMDTDDICFPDRFEKQVKYLESHPEIDIFSGWIEEFEGDISNVKSVRKVPETHEEIKNYIGSRNPLNHPAVVFRKDAVNKAGGYRHFPLFEDWYLWSRMMVSGAVFGNVQDNVLHFRTSADMFKRRGGFRYALDSIRFQRELHRLGLISRFSMLKSSIIRTAVYIMPNSIRSFIYKTFLR